MHIWFTRIDPARHRFRVARTTGDAIDLCLETRSFLLHDLAHYAIEAALETDHGFYGLLAAGVPLADLRQPEVLGEARLARLMNIERQAAMLQSAFKKNAPTPSPGWPLLRSLWGAWSKTRQGQALHLVWPGVAPEVVPSP